MRDSSKFIIKHCVIRTQSSRAAYVTRCTGPSHGTVAEKKWVTNREPRKKFVDWEKKKKKKKSRSFILTRLARATRRQQLRVNTRERELEFKAPC